MNKRISKLIEKFGIPTSNRSCYKSYIWDGSNLALYWQGENVEGLPYTKIEISDFNLLHEIAHWVVATPTEREFPEYGCMLGIAMNAGLGSFFVEGLGHLTFRDVEWGSTAFNNLNVLLKGVLTKEEQNFREACADLLGVYWCDLIGVPVKDEWRPTFKYADKETGWKAVIWL